MKMYTIYRIVCHVNGKCYVGQTSNVKGRRVKHFSRLRHDSHPNKYLQSDFTRYGEANFALELLEGDVLQENAHAREQFWVSHFDSYHNGYNGSFGGNNYDNYGIPCVWEGVEHPNYLSAARVAGISESAMRKRILKGYQNEAEVKAFKATQFARECEWNGERYVSISAASRALGIPYAALRKHMLAGCKTDADVRKMFRPYRRK